VRGKGCKVFSRKDLTRATESMQDVMPCRAAGACKWVQKADFCLLVICSILCMYKLK